MAFDYLLSPGRIGSMTLRNRILMSPMGDDLCNADGTVSEDQIAYFAARALGGVGCVIVGSVAVAYPYGTSNKFQTGISDDRFIDGFARLADVVHRAGGKVAVQLTHAGRVGINDAAMGSPMWVPSVPRKSDYDALFGQITAEEAAKQSSEQSLPTYNKAYHVMDEADIDQAVAWFADAAERLQRAGIDGCEILAGHGYLLDEFLSPSTNFRSDDYGGSVENRARFLVETVQGIRARVGPDFPLWVRLNAEEFFIDGITVDDALRTAQMAIDAGVDAIHVSAYANATVAIGYTEAHATHIPARFTEFARTFKTHLDVPIITVGRISPERAEELIEEGACDFVAMGRRLLADPELPNKLASGSSADVRPCAYHYRCISQIFVREGIRCAVNPRTGREREFPLSVSRETKRLLIAGGGPAGLEAARLAALQGHHVVLAEATERLGGKYAFAAQCYPVNADLLAWLLRQVRELPIDIQLNTTVDASYVRDAGVDAVIAALGGRWNRPPVAGGDLPHVFTADALNGWFFHDEALPGERVVVIGGGRAGMSMGERARRLGHDVTVLEKSSVFASQLGIPGRWRSIHEVQELGVSLISSAVVQHIDAHELTYTRREETVSIPADVILVADFVSPQAGLVEPLHAAGIAVHQVGDVHAAGTVEEALLQAAQLAVAL